MSLLERNLAKLTISAWKDREGKMPVGSMIAMYNPESIQLDYQTRFRKEDTVNSASCQNHFETAGPMGLSLNLLFDSQMPGNTLPVETQLAKLKSLCTVESGADLPHFLRITWGKMRWENKGWFAGRANELSITYSLFDRDAMPLRATVRLSLVADESAELQQSAKDQKSPSRALVNVKDSDSLPLLALGATGTLLSSVDYLSMAWQNDMDHLDHFQAGQTLLATKEDNR